jgi:hypothetical protein
VIGDFAKQNYLEDTQAGATLWPHLLYGYSRHSPPRSLPMVTGEFVDDEGDDVEDDRDE